MSRLLPYRRVVDAPAVRLFCLPPAGVGASLFRHWPDRLPPQIEVCGLQLPGRENRWRDPLPATLGALADELAAAVAGYLDIRYALFGHSFGAHLAFALAGRLGSGGGPAPRRLFLSAAPAPHLVPASRLPLAEHGQAEPPARELARFGFPPLVMADAGLRRLAYRQLSADLRLLTGPYPRPAPVHCPITVLAGRQDTTAPVEALAAWRAYTSGPFEVRLVDGDHGFVRRLDHPFLDLLAARLVPSGVDRSEVPGTSGPQ